MWTCSLAGSSNQPSCAPFSRYSSIFLCKAPIESEGERSSKTKSGQSGRNSCHCSSVNASSRSLRTQATSGAVGEIEAGGRTEDLAGAVAAGPLFKQENQLAASPSAASCFWRHNDDVSFRGAFDPQIAIELTELEELLVIHVNDRPRMDDQRLLPD